MKGIREIYDAIKNKGEIRLDRADLHPNVQINERVARSRCYRERLGCAHDEKQEVRLCFWASHQINLDTAITYMPFFQGKRWEIDKHILSHSVLSKK